MKRLIIASVFAIALHGVLLAVKVQEPQHHAFATLDKNAPLAVRMDYLPSPALKKQETVPPKKKAKVDEKPLQPKIAKVPPPVPIERRAEAVPADEKLIDPVDEPEDTEEQMVETIPELETTKTDVAEDSSKLDSPIKTSSSASSSLQPAPLYRLNSVPKYPRLARKRGYQGTVILEVLVSISGRVSDLRIHQSSGFGLLDKAALKAVKSWYFSAGLTEGVKAEKWVKLPVQFKLHSS